MALKVESNFPELSNRLIAALQLAKNLKENPEGYSTDMILAVMDQADATSARLNLKAIIDSNPIKKMSRWAAGLVIFFVVYALVFPALFKNSFYIFSHPLTEFSSPQKFSFVISPGNAEAVKYADVKIKIRIEGEKPDGVNLFWKNEGGDGIRRAWFGWPKTEKSKIKNRMR